MSAERQVLGTFVFTYKQTYTGTYIIARWEGANINKHPTKILLLYLQVQMWFCILHFCICIDKPYRPSFSPQIQPVFLKLFEMGRICRGKKGFVSAGKHNTILRHKHINVSHHQQAQAIPMNWGKTKKILDILGKNKSLFYLPVSSPR